MPAAGENGFERKVRQSEEALRSVPVEKPGLPRRPWVGALLGSLSAVLVEALGVSRWYIVLGLAAFAAWVYWDKFRERREQRRPQLNEPG